MKNQQFKLKAPYKLSIGQQIAVDKLVQNIKKGSQDQTLLGVTGSGKTFVMANVIERMNKPTLIISHNKTLAAQLFEEFKAFFPEDNVHYFVSYYDYYQPEAYLPGKDVYIEKESQVNKEIERYRLSAMQSIISNKNTIVVASVSAIYNIGNPNDYRNQTIVLRKNTEYLLSRLVLRLVFMQYERGDFDFVPGTFRVKGDVVDIFPPYADNAIRISFFGDYVEDIYLFNILTGERITDLGEIEIFPAKNFIFEKDIIKQAIEKIKKDLKIRVTELNKVGKQLEAQRLEQRTNYDIEMLQEVGYCKGMENYSIYFEDRLPGEPPYSLLDYFNENDYLLFIDESHITIPQIRGMYNGDRSRKQILVDYGFRLPSALDNRPLRFDEFLEKRGTTIYFSATPSDWEIKQSKNTIVELLTRPTGLLDPKIEVRPTKHQIDNIIEEVKQTIKKGERVLITTLTKRMAEDLTSYLQDIDIKVNYLHSEIDTIERVDILRSLRKGEYDVVVGVNLLREGIDLPEVSLVIILDADKEGFLRSKTSLIQIIGRAARHINGRVIAYADNMTDSLRYAVDETMRRRKVQEEYNKKFGIKPRSIYKEIREDLSKKTNEILLDDELLNIQPPSNLVKSTIAELEKKMFEASNALRFEEAIAYRNKINELKNNVKK